MRLFFWGRFSWLLIPVIILFLFLASVVTWDISFTIAVFEDHTSLAIPAIEVWTLFSAIILSWILAGRMDSWEVSSSQRPRVVGSVFVVMEIILMSITVAGRFRAGQWFPEDFVPSGFAGVTLRQLSQSPGVVVLERQSFVNALVISSFVFIGVGLLGRVWGFFLSLLLYSLVVAGTATSWFCSVNPYGQCLAIGSELEGPEVVAYVIAGILCVCAGGLWLLTGGSFRRGWGALLAWINRRMWKPTPRRAMGAWECENDYREAPAFSCARIGQEPWVSVERRNRLPTSG